MHPSERAATTTSLADAALQARLRHLETHVDELPKWTARIAALESDSRFAARDARFETLAASLTSAQTKLDATVASLASLLERLSGLERARDEGRSRTDRALDLATAAHEASRSLDARLRELADRVGEIEQTLRTLEAPDTTSHSEPLGPAPWLALDERLITLERATDAALRSRVEAMEARLISLVARFADIAARTPGESGGRASLLPPPPAPAPIPPTPMSSEASSELEALVRELVQRELSKLALSPSKASESADALRSVKGIGPAFADRLRASGIADVATLAALDDVRLDALAKAVGAPIAKLRKWRDTARTMH